MTRLDGDEGVEQARNFEKVSEAALGLGIFGMFARLHRETGGEDLRPVPGVVPHVKLVEDESRGHGEHPFSIWK